MARDPLSAGRFAVLVLQKFVEERDVEVELRAYLDTMLTLFDDVGARVAWAGRPMGTIVGDGSESWDVAMVVEYPSVEAAMQLAARPEFIEAMEYRSAAVARLEVHACTPLIDAPR